MDEIFQRLLDTNFAELAGLSADASVALPESLVNELMEVQLRGQRSITSARISVWEQNRMEAYVKTALIPWTLHLKLKLFHSLDLTGSPKMRAFLENNVLLGKLGAFFKMLPPGASMYNDQIIVDLGTFMNPQQKKLVELVKSVEISTETGEIILHIKIEK